MREARCTSCTALIFWVRTESNARMPIDYDPVPDGRVVVVAGVARFLRKGETTTAARFTSHFATCPNAARHRRRPLVPDYGTTPLAAATPAAHYKDRDYEAERRHNETRRAEREREKQRKPTEGT